MSTQVEKSLLSVNTEDYEVALNNLRLSLWTGSKDSNSIYATTERKGTAIPLDATYCKINGNKIAEDVADMFVRLYFGVNDYTLFYDNKVISSIYEFGKTECLRFALHTFSIDEIIEGIEFNSFNDYLSHLIIEYTIKLQEVMYEYCGEEGIIGDMLLFEKLQDMIKEDLT